MYSYDLIELLSERPIYHPTWIDGISWSGRRLVVAIRGSCWWEGPHTGQPTNGEACLVFEELGEGCLRTDELDPEWDEALEDFEIVRVSDVPWALARDHSIFCSEPIGDPLTVYRRVHDYLCSNNAFFHAEDFLNRSSDLSEFATMTSSTGFMLCRGPTCIRDLVCDELTRQAVRHNNVEGKVRGWPKFLVRIGASSFLCGSAALVPAVEGLPMNQFRERLASRSEVASVIGVADVLRAHRDS